jgi:hypothetical protein
MSVGAVSSSNLLDPRFSAERPAQNQQNVQIAALRAQSQQDQAVAQVVAQASEQIASNANASQASNRSGVGGNLDIRI